MLMLMAAAAATLAVSMAVTVEGTIVIASLANLYRDYLCQR